MSMKDKRGVVIVAYPIMFDFEVMKVFYSEFFPFRIDYDPFDKAFRLCGCSERFTEVKEGDPLAQYEFIFFRNDSDILTIKEVLKTR